MSIVASADPIVHAPPKHPCPACESTDCLCAPERWDADERAEWLEAEMRDRQRESGGGW